MTIEERKAFFEGKALWNKYVELNGYAFEPDSSGLAKLAKETGQSKSALRKTINIYLSN